jgi:hypothetical protein
LGGDFSTGLSTSSVEIRRPAGYPIDPGQTCFILDSRLPAPRRSRARLFGRENWHVPESLVNLRSASFDQERTGDAAAQGRSVRLGEQQRF